MAHTQIESRLPAPALRTRKALSYSAHSELSATDERELRMRLARWSRRFLGLPDAEFPDAYQGAWRKVLDGERRGRSVRNLEHALRWGIHNSWLEECRRRRRRPTAPLEETAPTAYRTQAPPDPAEQVERLESARYLFEAVGTIDELSWRVVLLRRVWGLSPAEVCSTLGISRRTYRTEHARALTLIYKRLSETLAGQECAGRHDSLRAVAASEAEGGLEEEVGAHVRNCSGCRRLLASMQRGEPIAA
jgi:RNA polymerase sigma factor (sigma-70 family)